MCLRWFRPWSHLAVGLLLLGTVLLLGMYSDAPRMEVASTAKVSEPPVSQRLAVPAASVRSACSLTGDLVGDANPADIARVLCGESNQSR
jgi:hypothetical protein